MKPHSVYYSLLDNIQSAWEKMRDAQILFDEHCQTNFPQCTCDNGTMSFDDAFYLETWLLHGYDCLYNINYDATDPSHIVIRYRLTQRHCDSIKNNTEKVLALKGYKATYEFKVDNPYNRTFTIRFHSDGL